MIVPCFPLRMRSTMKQPGALFTDDDPGVFNGLGLMYFLFSWYALQQLVVHERIGSQFVTRINFRR